MFSRNFHSNMFEKYRLDNIQSLTIKSSWMSTYGGGHSGLKSQVPLRALAGWLKKAEEGKCPRSPWLAGFFGGSAFDSSCVQLLAKES